MRRPNPTCFHKECKAPRTLKYTCHPHAYFLVATPEAGIAMTPNHIGHYLLGHLAG